MTHVSADQTKRRRKRKGKIDRRAAAGASLVEKEYLRVNLDEILLKNDWALAPVPPIMLEAAPDGFEAIVLLFGYLAAIRCAGSSFVADVADELFAERDGNA